MRKDMHRLITECGRSWAPDRRRARSWRARGVDVDQLDDLPAKGAMRPRGFYRKGPGDRLAPLRRYLQTMVGRHVNEVLSDVAQIQSPLHRNHVMDHVASYLDVGMGDGLLRSWRGLVYWKGYVSHGPVYVGADGIIRKACGRG